jgi:rubredoxin
MWSTSFPSWPCFWGYEPESGWPPNDRQAGQPEDEEVRR